MPALMPALMPAVLLTLAVVVMPGRRQASRDRLAWLSRALPPPTRRSVVPLRRSVAVADVADLAERLAAGFRAGLPPARAWSALSARGGAPAATVGAVLPWLAMGIPSGQALRRAAAPAPPALLALAVALDVCERTGAPTADVLDGLAVALRAEVAAAHEREVALAAPRATARVMSGLPAAGLAMAALLGADTFGVLTSTWAGRACLIGGGGCWACGHWWIRRLVAAAAGRDRR
ncbi:MAG: type II secretion system F family protein [Kineosporiaceae bacterium]